MPYSARRIEVLDYCVGNKNSNRKKQKGNVFLELDSTNSICIFLPCFFLEC